MEGSFFSWPGTIFIKFYNFVLQGSSKIKVFRACGMPSVRNYFVAFLETLGTSYFMNNMPRYGEKLIRSIFGTCLLSATRFKKFIFSFIKKTEGGFRSLLTPLQPFRRPPSTKKFSISKGPPFGFSSPPKSGGR